MRKVSALLLSVLVISLFASLGFVESTYASPKEKPQKIYYTVWMPTGKAESNPEWLKYIYPIHWWNDPYRPPFPPEEYTIGDKLYVCHGDWFVECAVKEGNFRYQWWIFWDSIEAAMEPGAKSLGGYFIFSHGTGAFEGMYAFGKAWVEMLPGEYYPVGYQYHVGLMFGGPE